MPTLSKFFPVAENSIRSVIGAALLASVVLVEPVVGEDPPPSTTPKGNVVENPSPNGDGVKQDPGKTSPWTDLKGKWSECQFGGDGPIEISDQVISLGYGDPISAVYWTGEFPKTNYRFQYEAKRTDGFDFFAAATFPVGDSHVTFVPAGWGGGVTGISSIDGFDASENETTQYFPLESDQWYTFRVEVTDQMIRTFIDGKSVHDVQRKGKKFSLRSEMGLCRPLGIAAFQADAQIRNIKFQPIDPTTKSSNGNDGSTDD